MNGNDLIRIGYQSGLTLGLALKAAKAAHASGIPNKAIKDSLGDLLKAPDGYINDPFYGPVANELLRVKTGGAAYDLDSAAPFQTWGAAQIEPGAVEQMKRAVRLPVAVRGALMPDAHAGYGLPIGGVLATHNAVIPYAVGIDIACRMRLTIFDKPPFFLEQKREKFRKAIEQNTRFGMGQEWARTARSRGYGRPGLE